MNLLKKLVKFSIDKPVIIILLILLITVGLGYSMVTLFEMETDMASSLPRELDVTKFLHLIQKKFPSGDSVIIGIEDESGSVFNIKTIRYIDKLITEIKSLNVVKEYESVITGKKEKIELNPGIDYANVNGLTNASKIIVDDYGNVETGNIIEIARKKVGLTLDDTDAMKELPENDEDLQKLLPVIKTELMNDEMFKGTMISEDATACAVMVPMIDFIAKKRVVINNELEYMVDAEALERKLSGQNFDFPHNIFGKTINGITIDKAFIENHVKESKQK